MYFKHLLVGRYCIMLVGTNQSQCPVHIEAPDAEQQTTELKRLVRLQPNFVEYTTQPCHAGKLDAQHPAQSTPLWSVCSE